MTLPKFRSLFLLLFFQCYLGFTIKGEADNDHSIIQSIENFDTDISNAPATEETDRPIQKSSDYQSSDKESLKSTKIGDHQTHESKTNPTEDITNKTTDQSTNQNLTMHSKIGARGGKTGGSKVGGSKGGGSKTRIGGWRPSNKSIGGSGGGLVAFLVILGIVGVCGVGFVLVLLGLHLFGKRAGSNSTDL